MPVTLSGYKLRREVLPLSEDEDRPVEQALGARLKSIQDYRAR